MDDERSTSTPRPAVVERAVPELPPPPRQRRGWIVRLVLVALFLGIVALFVYQNDDRVEVRLIAWDVEIRLAWALLISAVLGFAVGLLRPGFRR